MEGKNTESHFLVRRGKAGQHSRGEPSGPPWQGWDHTFWSAAMKPDSPLRSSTFPTASHASPLRSMSSPLRSMFSPLRRVLHHGEAARIPGLYKYLRRALFPSTRFLCDPSSPVSSCVHFVLDFESFVTTMVPKKTIPTKQYCSSSTSQAVPPPLEDPLHFISQEAEWLYHESFCIRSFISERGFPTSNAFFNFTIQTRSWQTLCASPTPGVALVILEF